VDHRAWRRDDGLMLGAINEAIGALSQRLQRLEVLPWNQYSPDAQMFDHFAGDGTIDVRWTTTLNLSATISLPNSTPTYASFSSGATAASVAALTWGTRVPLVGMAAGVDMRWRARYPLAINANTASMNGFRGPTAFTQLCLGVLGSTSTAFFVARSIDPAAVTITTTTTTVAIDTAWHDWRIQTMPDRVRYYIDNVLVAEHINGDPVAVILPVAQPLSPYLEVGNGATSADRQMDVDLVWIRESVS
jgi:hypothetical protein